MSTFRPSAEDPSDQAVSADASAQPGEFLTVDEALAEESLAEESLVETSLAAPPAKDPAGTEHPSDSFTLDRAATSARTASDLPGQAPAVRYSKFENLKQVLNVLRAYVVSFGQPGSEAELRAVIGAVVANVEAVRVEQRDLEKFTNEAIAAFKSLGMEASLVDASAQLLAEQVAVWLQAQEAMVKNVLSAYLQQFAPDNAEWRSETVIALVQTIIATLNDGSLSRSVGRALVRRVVETFDLGEALSRWVAPESVALAQQVASYLDKGYQQTELQSISWAYVQQFQAILSPQLIEQIIQQGPINVSPAELLSRDLSDFSQMLFYKFQLLEADPVVTKSHEAIAADLHRAVADLQARRQPGLDVAAGHQEDLSVYSVFVRPNKPDVG